MDAAPRHAAPSSTTVDPSQPGRRRVSERAGAISPSATLAVDARARELRAAGRPVIGFGAGEPDFPSPAHVVAAAQAAAADPVNHHYSAGAGLPALREAVAAATLASDHVEVSPAQVLITNGGKQAVYETFAALLDPGDEIIVPAPYWTTYPEAIALTGASPVPVLAGVDQDYLVSMDQLEAARTPATKAVLLVSPSNPTGAVMSRAQITELGRWALEHDLWVISDEIYQHLVYDGAEFTSILDAVPELADRTILLNGVAKTYAMTGWRVGWMIGPSDVVQAASNLQSHLTGNVSNVSQRAAIAALTGPTEPVTAMREAFDARRRLIVSLLRQVHGFTVPVPRGAFYAFPDVTGVYGRRIGGTTIESSADLATALLDAADVAAVPGEAFGAPGHLRFSYALGEESISTGVGRIIELLA